MKNKRLSDEQEKELLKLLQARFEKHTHRHGAMDWSRVQARLEDNPAKIRSLYEMEETGGEPDVIGYDEKTNEYIFCDCAAESPKGR